MSLPLSAEERYAILVRDDFTCQKCGRGGKKSVWILEVHHIEERKNGGNNNPSNLVTLCVECHNNMPGHKWRWTIPRYRIFTFDRRKRELGY